MDKVIGYAKLAAAHVTLAGAFTLLIRYWR